MASVSVQPGVVVAAGSFKRNQWSSGLCDCCDDIGICCCGFWCTYCLMCKTSEDFGECLCLPMLEICFGGCLHPITFAMRSSMRERYNIQGSIQNDCCAVTCCTVCVWCQMARELKAQKRSLMVINTTVNTIHQQPQPFNQQAFNQQAFNQSQAFNQPQAFNQQAFNQPQAVNMGYEPIDPADSKSKLPEEQNLLFC